VIALEALAALRREELARAGRVKEHYIRLTDIVRPYLERRFGVPALDLTTSEILAAIAGTGGDTRALGEGTAKAELMRLLEEADLVKFARLEPPAPLAEGAIDRAADFVRETARVPVVPVVPAAARPVAESALPAPAQEASEANR
jgi:hypothetical protein